MFAFQYGYLHCITIRTFTDLTVFTFRLYLSTTCCKRNLQQVDTNYILLVDDVSGIEGQLRKHKQS